MLKKLECLYQINGFTVGKDYDVVEDGANIVTVFDNNLILRKFNKVEGNSDFKNWFRGSR